MCGITGFLLKNNKILEPEQVLVKMTSTLHHRGPDDQGIWFDSNSGIGLGHKRLSIIDLSPEGHQPMHSSSNRFVVSFNGEIYNFQQLRKQLEGMGFTFRGHSDTEVLLAAIEAWGLEEAVKQFIGMFAFALWDKMEQRLHLVRDRIGIKPLYYGEINGSFVFGSELKSICAFNGARPTVNRDALALFLRHNYIPAPHSIYNGVWKLMPGHILSISTDKNNNYEPRAYWSLNNVVVSGVKEKFAGVPEEAIEQLDLLLRDAISLRMIADVPLGVFLSGGVDSSTVAALMQAQRSKPVKTFTIGFNEEKYNEAEFAKKIAKHLHTEHTELYVTPSEAQNVIPRLPEIYDEPFADSSQIPTFLISQLTKKHVTVALSGDGGDELFCGYQRYYYTQNVWNAIRKVPRGILSLLSNLIKVIPVSKLNEVTKLLPDTTRDKLSGDRIHKFADILRATDAATLYRLMISNWKDPTGVVLGSKEPATIFTDPNINAYKLDFYKQMMFLDQATYLPEDILTKVDRASMAVALEARVPLLDHRVIDFAWKLPNDLKYRDGKSKWLLRQVLYKYVPPELIERSKMGFGVPIDMWLRGPLKEYASDLLDENTLKRQGYFDPLPIKAKWREHMKGTRRWHAYLWTILMFQAWLQKS